MSRFLCLSVCVFNRYLLVPVGESHHDVQRSQTEMEVKKGVAVRDSFLLIVHSPACSILSHNTLSTRLSALLCLHQLVHLGVTRRTDARGQTERFFFPKYKYKTEHTTSFLVIYFGSAKPTLHRGCRRGRWPTQQCPERPTTAPFLECCHQVVQYCWRLTPDSTGWGYSSDL